MKKILLICLIFIGLKATAQETLYIGVGSNIGKQNPKLVGDLCKYLSESTGFTVTAVVKPKTTQLLEEIKEGKVDLALLNTFGYILASDAGFEPLLIIANPDKKAITYQSCIIANPSTGLKTMAIVKERAHEFYFTFVNASSTSGHLLPRLYLTSIELEPEIAFKEIKFGETHTQTVMQIVENKSQIAACSYTDMQKMIEKGTIKASDVNVLWVSEPITNGPIAVKKTLSASKKEKLKKAFLELSTKNPALQAQVVKIWHNTNENSIYVPATDALFAPIHSIVKSLEYLWVFVGLYSE
jgi:phosphonate transport system substrate-binding protein